MIHSVVRSLRPLAGVFAAASLLACAATAHAQCPVVLEEPTTHATIATGRTSVAAGDLNGDGLPDLVVSGQISASVSVLLNDGNGNFVQPSVNYTIPDGVCCNYLVRVAQMNNDNHLDVVCAGTGATVAVFLGNGDGTLQSSLTQPTGSIPSNFNGFAVARLNADAFPDVALPTPSGVNVYLNTGSGGLSLPTAFGGAISCTNVVAGDFNGDGALDLVHNAGNCGLLLGDGQGGFTVASADLGIGGGRGLTTADFNGDGHADIARGSSNVVIALGNGDGTFTPGTPTAPGTSPWHVRAADFNGDGKPDLGLSSLGNPVSQFHVLLGNGDGTFASPTSMPLGPLALEHDTADFNDDGLRDIAVPILNQNVAVILQSAATGPILDPLAAAPALNGSVRAILPYLEQNNLVPFEQTVVAGAFTKFGVTPMARVALYNGATFIQIGDGLNSTVSALTHHDLDAGGINPTEIIAGGAFTKSGLTKLFKVAAFDGKFWHPLGDSDPVLPADAELSEGNSGNNPLNGGGTVSQLHYIPSDMPDLLPGDQIIGMRLRLDVGRPSYPDVETTWTRFDVALGEGKDTLTTTLADNFVRKPTVVRKGPLVMAPGFFQGSGAPRWFSDLIAFDKPFTYKGGNLLLETRFVAPAVAPITDASGRGRPASAFANAVGPEGADATTANIGIFNDNWVIQLLIVPGPAHGFNGNVNALVSGIFDGQTARGADPVLVAGGAFTKSGATSVNRVAMWDGDKWVPIGAGFNGAVNALLIADLDGNGPDGPSLIAGGAFTKSGANVVNRIARFDGANWQPLGTGFNGAVNALALHAFADGGEQLVAGGAFSKAGVTVLNRVARFDNQNWQPIGDGFKSTVNTLVSEALLDTAARGLIAGGAFTKSGLNIVNRLALLEGDAWAQLGDGAASTVRALSRTDNAHSALGPHLKVGGDFKKSGVLIQPFITAFGCPSDVLRAARAALPPGVVPPCSIADIAGGGEDGSRPDGQITLDDALAYVKIISSIEPAALDALDNADKADDDTDTPLDIPEGETTLTDDVIAFVQAYIDGCP